MTVRFGPRSSQIQDEQDEILRQIAEDLSTRPDVVTLRVEGHSSTCLEELNDRALSEARARAVAARLVALGLDERSIVVVGYGSTMPRKHVKEVADDCGPDAAIEQKLSHERRVEFSIRRCSRQVRGERVACADPDAS